jgi:hypothetical protein
MFGFILFVIGIIIGWFIGCMVLGVEQEKDSFISTKNEIDPSKKPIFPKNTIR